MTVFRRERRKKHGEWGAKAPRPYHAISFVASGLGYKEYSSATRTPRIWRNLTTPFCSPRRLGPPHSPCVRIIAGLQVGMRGRLIRDEGFLCSSVPYMSSANGWGQSPHSPLPEHRTPFLGYCFRHHSFVLLSLTFETPVIAVSCCSREGHPGGLGKVVTKRGKRAYLFNV